LESDPGALNTVLLFAVLGYRPQAAPCYTVAGFDKILGSSFLISRNPAAFHRLSKSVNLEYNFSSDYLIVTT
ncbi:MAG: hypothetical protein J5631_02900, partial [Spirochaetaceae bacterium]|nr:hypothetical protein [Spirochaetaceae bacterium]